MCDPNRDHENCVDNEQDNARQTSEKPNTLDDTLYIYPEGQDFSVTKFALATEEIYRRVWRGGAASGTAKQEAQNGKPTER